MPNKDEIAPVAGWGGFKAPNYTNVPDDLFDVLLPVLTDVELRVLLYIIRRTFGFKKQADDISFTQLVKGITTRDGRKLDSGAGVSRNGAQLAVERLETRGIIVVTRNHTERGDNATSTYRLRMEGDPMPHGGIPYTPAGHTPMQQGGPPLYPGGASQETVVQNTEYKIVSSELRDTEELDEGPEPPYSPWIAQVIVDYSRELGDIANVEANTRRAMRLWQRSGLAEELFVQALQAAKVAARKQPGRGWAAMNRFFEALGK